MKIGSIVHPLFDPTLEKLSNEPLPLKAAYKVRVIVKAVQAQKVEYNELRDKALTTYGDKNEDGTLKVDEHGGVQFSGDNYKNFVKEISDLYAVEFETQKLTPEELGDIKLSAAELAAIEDILAF